MLNYEIDPNVLAPFVPKGTELDSWHDKTLVSVVGFRFLETRLCGWSVPFHRDFDEVNLRFYVCRHSNAGLRRGVVFVKELVPRRAIAWVARAVYGEKYVAVPMSHEIQLFQTGEFAKLDVSYSWQFLGRPSRLAISVHGEPCEFESGSEEEFITEHYWGFTRGRNGRTLEYQVDHPPWRIWHADVAHLDCDVERLYGKQFVDALRHNPVSAFLAEGSDVKVYRGSVLQSSSGP